MKTGILLIGVALLSACATRPKENQTQPQSADAAIESLAPDLRITKLKDDIYVVTHLVDFAPANSLVAVLAPDWILMVDTPYTPRATRTVLEWIRTRFGKRRIVAVNTHSHVDRIGGNEVLKEEKIPIFGSDKTVERIASLSAWERGNLIKIAKDPALKQDFERLRFTPPDHVFKLKDGAKLDFEDETVEVYFPGAAHTPDNVVVYLPKQRVLFGGCMIVSYPKLGFTGQADLKAWPESLRHLRRFDFDFVVPGHGESTSPELIEHTESLLKKAL